MRLRLRNIIIGWGKYWGILPTTKAEDKLSELRLKQCMKCDMSDRSKVLQLIDGHAKYEHQLYCTQCKCPCKQKSVVVDENCPLGKW